MPVACFSPPAQKLVGHNTVTSPVNGRDGSSINGRDGSSVKVRDGSPVKVRDGSPVNDRYALY